MSAIHFDYVVDEHMRRYDVIGRNDTRLYDLNRLDDYRCSGCGHDRIEVRFAAISANSALSGGSSRKSRPSTSTVRLPSATVVPTPVAVNTPPSP
jgi:hypothetical protein